MANKKYIINSDLYDAVLFDLDGVVTKTENSRPKNKDYTLTGFK